MTYKFSRRKFMEVAAISMAAVAAGCATASPEEEPVPIEKEPANAPEPSIGEKITIWISSLIHEEYWPPLVETFQAENPDFGHEIEVILVSGGIYEKFIAALVAGKGAPDSINMADSWMAGMWKSGVAGEALYDLIPFLLEDYPNYNTEYMKWSPWTDPNGKIYGLEVALCPTVYYYRKDLHDEAGVDPTTYVTYDDFIEGGMTFNACHPGKFSTVADLGGIDSLRILMEQNGGGLFDAAGNVTIDCDENIEALQLIWDMAMEYKMAWPCPNVWGPGMWAALEDGTASGNIGADWYGGGILKMKVPDQIGVWAAAPMPIFKEGGSRSVSFGGGGYLITKQSKAPDAVWDILTHILLTKEGQLVKYETAQYFPTRLDVMNDPRVVDAEDPYYFEGQKVGAVLAEVGPEAVIAPSHPFLGEARTVLKNVVPIVAAGEKSPEVALQDAAEEMRNLVAQG